MKAYAAPLLLADEMGFESIAFPVLATGNNSFDANLAIDIATESLKQYQPKNRLAQAHLVTFGGAITQNMRNRGYEVEESIDQMHVLDQDVHQADVVQNDVRWKASWNPERNPLQEFLDGGLKWIQEPVNQKMMLDIAIGVLSVVLPDKGAAGNVKKALDVVAPFNQGNWGTEEN